MHLMKGCGQLHAPLLYSWHPLDRRLHGLQSWSEHCEDEKNLLLLASSWLFMAQILLKPSSLVRHSVPVTISLWENNISTARKLHRHDYGHTKYATIHGLHSSSNINKIIKSSSMRWHCMQYAWKKIAYNVLLRKTEKKVTIREI
jgi:hypothetical protein